MLINARIKGIRQLQKFLSVEGKRQKKALELAMRIEGYQLRKELSESLARGEPSKGHRLKSLTYLARGLGIRTGRRVRKDVPLIRFRGFVRYHIKKAPYEIHVGFSGPRVPQYIKDWVKLHERGFTRPVTNQMRKKIIGEGARRGTIEGGRTPFFLKKSTRQFRTPARRIVAPFWLDHKVKARRNITENFLRKLKGHRI